MPKIYAYDIVKSTNDLAREKASKLKNGDIIWALSQTNGRGKGERSWHSPKGGLWFSIVFKPQRLSKDPNVYTKMASIAVVKVLKKFKIKEVGVKWPNDIYHGKEKLGGILTEIMSQGKEHVVIVGVGLNVSNELPADVPNATSLFKITGEEISVPQLLKKISSEMERLYNFVTSGKRNVITNLWRNAMIIKKGSKIKVVEHNSKEYHATVVRVLSNSLIVEHDGVRESVHPSEIFFA